MRPPPQRLRSNGLPGAFAGVLPAAREESERLSGADFPDADLGDRSALVHIGESGVIRPSGGASAAAVCWPTYRS